MASRENQSYVIAVIALSIITVLLLVSTVYAAMKWNDAHDKMLAAQSESTFRGALADAFEAQSKLFSACLGVGETAVSEIGTLEDQIASAKGKVDASRRNTFDSIEEATKSFREVYSKDMAFNSAITAEGEGSDEAGMTYKATFDRLTSALRASNENVFVKAQEALRIQQNSAQQIETLNNTIKEKDAALVQREKDLADEQERNRTQEQALQDRAVTLQNSMDTQQQEFDNRKETLENTIAGLEGVKADLEMKNSALKAKVNDYEREVFDLADGEVVRIEQASKTVFIDMGSLDGIRPNLTFVIYDRVATDFKKDRHKAKIEVTEIVGPRLSKARITEEDPLNPILTKDQVVSATFDRGDTVNIALAGWFDIDGDGASDFEKLKQMIVRNGGRVVAWHDEDGNITGEIDSTTRFFVLGKSTNTGGRQIAKAISALKEQAEGNSVDTIDQQKLLTWIGVHRNAKVQRMDQGIGRDSQFQERSPTGR